MHWVKNKQSFLYWGILGSAISVIADLSLAYYPQKIAAFSSAFTISLAQLSSLLAQTSTTRLAWSSRLALIGIPLGWFGLWYVYQQIKPVGKWLSQALLIIGSLGYIAGTIFHVTLAFQALAYIFLVSIFIVSILFVIAVLTGKTKFPLWFAVFNPATLEILIAAIASVSPLYLKTFLIVTIYNFSLLVFYSLCAVVKFAKS